MYRFIVSVFAHISMAYNLQCLTLFSKTENTVIVTKEMCSSATMNTDKNTNNKAAFYSRIKCLMLTEICRTQS